MYIYPEEVGEITKTISTTTEKYNIGKALQYFPDSYIQYFFPFGIPEHLQEEANKWYSDYLELMEQRKDPEYGSTKCYECLLWNVLSTIYVVGNNIVTNRTSPKGVKVINASMHFLNYDPICIF
jgi:hypothetical protein